MLFRLPLASGEFLNSGYNEVFNRLTLILRYYNGCDGAGTDCMSLLLMFDSCLTFSVTKVQVLTVQWLSVNRMIPLLR